MHQHTHASWSGRRLSSHVIAAVVALLPLNASAQSVCEGLALILNVGIEAGNFEDDLQFHSLPNAICETERHALQCFWKSKYQAKSSETQDYLMQEVKRFTGLVDKCIKNDELPVESWEWNRWKNKGAGHWVIRTDVIKPNQGRYNLFELSVAWGFKEFLDFTKYDDETVGILLGIKLTE